MPTNDTGVHRARLLQSTLNRGTEMIGLQTTRKMFAATLLMCGGAACSTVTGQGMVTDRPDFTESAVTVPAGYLQFEGGATYSSLGGDLSEVVVGEALLRWGVLDRVEIRIGGPSYMSVSNGGTHSGFGDGSLGAKMQLGPLGSGWDVATIATASVPVGDDEFSSGEVDPSLIMTAGRALNETLSLGGQIVASWPTQGDDREFEWGGTLVLGSEIGLKMGAFIEVAVTVPESGTAPIVGHAGLIYGLSDSFQLDAHAGIGLSDTAPDLFIGVGVARLVR